MIESSLHETALKSIHFMTVQGRGWAYNQEPHKQIADLLDDTEYLLVMLFQSEDRTDEFLDYLEESAKRHRCLHAYDMLSEQVEATGYQRQPSAFTATR